MTLPSDRDDELAAALAEDDDAKPATTSPQGARAATGTSLDSSELGALTFVGATVSVQLRSYANLADGGQDSVLAVHHPPRAPRSRENGRPYELAELDVVKLRDLLNEATARGLLP